MPFDGTTAQKTRRPKQHTTAIRSVLVRDIVESFFRDGAMWARDHLKHATAGAA